MTVEECASNLGDGTTQTRAHHDVERQRTPWAKLILPELVDRIAAYAARQLLRSNRLKQSNPIQEKQGTQGCVAKLERQMIR